MGKKGRLEGDSGSITTQGKVGPQSLRNYLKAQAFGIRTARFTFLNGNASGGATILAGPNRTAAFPLAAPAVAGGTGAAYTWYNVLPEDMSIDDGGTASTVYFTYGGECEADSER